MIYLSGHIREASRDIGFILTPNSETKLPPGRLWAADSGRFTEPETYGDAKYLAWLGKRRPMFCLFATAPDVVGDHEATLELSRSMFAPIRALGYPVALVAQDGWDGAPWDDFDVLFVGGTTAFKTGPKVPCIVREARQRGKWVHMGRVNSYNRMKAAQVIGCQSVDGTFLRFGPDNNAAELDSWVQRVNQQPVLSL